MGHLGSPGSLRVTRGQEGSGGVTLDHHRLLRVYFIPIDKNIAKYKVYVNPARLYAGLKYILQLLL